MEYIKKYWFVALVAVLFTVAIVFFAVSEDKDKFKGKTVNGSDVLFEYNSTDVTSDELFDEVFEQQAPGLATYFVQFGVYANSMETTDELKAKAKESAEGALSYYKYTYGQDYLDYLLPTLRTYGYSSIDDLEDYFITYYKMIQYQTDYYVDNCFDEFNKEKAPRLLSHILVKMADPQNPTEEELAKVKEIDDALASGKDFAEVATELSDDTGSATNGGQLGYSDTDSAYVDGFFEAAQNLKTGEVSEWTITTYGYHLIKVDSCELEDLKNDESFFSAISEYCSKDATMLDELYKKADIDYHGNDFIKEFIENEIALGIESEQAALEDQEVSE